MDEGEKRGLWLFAGLVVGALLMIGIRGIDIFPPLAPASCDEACRSAHDLAAQQSMAIAAWAMAVLAVFSAIIGVFGLIAVLATLRETRRQAVAAESEVANTQTAMRADLSVRDVQVILGEGPIQVAFEVVNSGQTPARDVSLEVSIIVTVGFDENAKGYHNTHALHGTDIDGASLSNFRTVIFSVELSKLIAAENPNITYFTVFIGTKYVDIFGKDRSALANFSGHQRTSGLTVPLSFGTNLTDLHAHG